MNKPRKALRRGRKSLPREEAIALGKRRVASDKNWSEHCRRAALIKHYGVPVLAGEGERRTA